MPEVWANFASRAQRARAAISRMAPVSLRRMSSYRSTSTFGDAAARSTSRARREPRSVTRRGTPPAAATAPPEFLAPLIDHANAATTAAQLCAIAESPPTLRDMDATEEEAMIDAMVDDARRAEDEADLAAARLHKLATELYELTRRRDALRRVLVAFARSVAGNGGVRPRAHVAGFCRGGVPPRLNVF